MREKKVALHGLAKHYRGKTYIYLVIRMVRVAAAGQWQIYFQALGERWSLYSELMTCSSLA